MTETVLSQVQAVETGFLRRVQGVTLRDRVRMRVILKTLNVKTLRIKGVRKGGWG